MAAPPRKTCFLYLANDVMQNSRRKTNDFVKEFANVLTDAISDLAASLTPQTKKDVERLIQVWQDRKVFAVNFCNVLRDRVNHGGSGGSSSSSSSSTFIDPSHPPEIQQLIPLYNKYKSTHEAVKALPSNSTTAAAPILPDYQELDPLSLADLFRVIKQVEQQATPLLSEYSKRDALDDATAEFMRHLLVNIGQKIQQDIADQDDRLTALAEFREEYEQRGYQAYLRRRLKKTTPSPPPQQPEQELQQEDSSSSSLIPPPSAPGTVAGGASQALGALEQLAGGTSSSSSTAPPPPSASSNSVDVDDGLFDSAANNDPTELQDLSESTIQALIDDAEDDEPAAKKAKTTSAVDAAAKDDDAAAAALEDLEDMAKQELPSIDGILDQLTMGFEEIDESQSQRTSGGSTIMVPNDDQTEDQD
eukprot:TRINITY_DN53798_c0_g1_i1.p1 TRINITY_DN53798_c0_g1~~TRINITY_DN53798_c0_g1_i1.p1  ORF type:complete len:473 (+),score=76.95 TRINITY_DN53798_c0_g1_i1:163-1419(+)